MGRMAARPSTEWLAAPPWDQEWDEERDRFFYRRLPLVIESIVRARTVAAVTGSILHGGVHLWPDAVMRLDGVDGRLSEAALIDGAPRHISRHGRLPDLRRGTSLRAVESGVEVAVTLVGHGAALGRIVLTPPGPDGWVSRQQRGHLRAYAEICSAALHSCLALAELRRMALTDRLTGIPNRRALDHELDRLDADGAGFGLLFVDADGLGTVNTSLGYEAGGELIGAVARALTDALGPDDLAARLGGDEFVAIVRDPAFGDAVSARVSEVFARRPLSRPVAERTRGVSVGFVARREGESAREALRRGAEAMRMQKNSRKAGA
jgi:diguanylate cyclase (GGDEF)-like protein